MELIRRACQSGDGQSRPYRRSPRFEGSDRVQLWKKRATQSCSSIPADGTYQIDAPAFAVLFRSVVALSDVRLYLQRCLHPLARTLDPRIGRAFARWPEA